MGMSEEMISDDKNLNCFIDDHLFGQNIEQAKDLSTNEKPAII